MSRYGDTCVKTIMRAITNLAISMAGYCFFKGIIYILSKIKRATASGCDDLEGEELVGDELLIFVCPYEERERICPGRNIALWRLEFEAPF